MHTAQGLFLAGFCSKKGSEASSLKSSRQEKYITTLQKKPVKRIKMGKTIECTIACKITYLTDTTKLRIPL